jgi:high-affinity iron transporter
MSGTFVQAAAILLREGLEALLVLAALAAYLDKAGGRSRLPVFWTGAALAVVASLIAALLFAAFNNGAHSDLLEGFVMLLAAGLMLYVSGWLLLRQDPRAWQAFLKTQADEALAKRTGLAVALLAFLAVFREGAETVLFVHTLSISSGGWSIALIGGLLAAAAGLVALFFLINMVAHRVPLRPLFVVTSAFLFFMAVKFVGTAVQEFQEQAWVSYTEVRTGGSVLAALGFNPTWEAVAAQLAVVVLAVMSYLAVDRRTRLAASDSGQTRAS